MTTVKCVELHLPTKGYTQNTTEKANLLGIFEKICIKKYSDLGGELGLCVASNLVEVFKKPFFTEKPM